MFLLSGNIPHSFKRMCIAILPAVYVSHLVAHGVQKRALDPLELDTKN